MKLQCLISFTIRKSVILPFTLPNSMDYTPDLSDQCLQQCLHSSNPFQQADNNMKTIQLEAINTYFDIQCQLNVSNVKYLACIDMLLFLHEDFKPFHPAPHLSKFTQTVEQLQNQSSAMEDVKKDVQKRLLSSPTHIPTIKHRSYLLLMLFQYNTLSGLESSCQTTWHKKIKKILSAFQGKMHQAALLPDLEKKSSSSVCHSNQLFFSHHMGGKPLEGISYN